VTEANAERKGAFTFSDFRYLMKASIPNADSEGSLSAVNSKQP